MRFYGANTVLHIPHASRLIPADVREQFVLTAEDLDAEILAMTDAHTDSLFHALVPGAREIVFPVSRLVVDPERFVDDDAETMSRVGMGVVYTRTSSGTALRRRLAATERTALLDRFREPHHAALTAATNSALEISGMCLIIDCHSFPSVPLAYEFDQDPERPDICVGTDPTHTPADLIENLRHEFRAAGLSVSVNRPFAGSVVPAEYYQRDKRVMSVMIEVNRRLYMDEATGERCARFGQTRGWLASAIAAITSRRGA